MKIELIKTNIIKALENVGIFIDESIEKEHNLKNYIENSIQFISMIIEIEEIFEIEIPTELLSFHNFDSIEKISIILQELINNSNI